MFKLTNSWNEILKEELQKPYIQEIENFLVSEKNAGKKIFPEEKNIFNALNSTDFNDVKVVILGQDPYHGESQAHGFSFSVQDGVRVPPSLRNIFKEIESDLGIAKDATDGNLESWSKQGVLLLNAILTVEKGAPASHGKMGWEQFTNTIIQKISENNKNVVFLLWGAFAKSKAKLIDSSKNLILETSHPSPLGSYRGFLGSKHFSQTNAYLEKNGMSKINW